MEQIRLAADFNLIKNIQSYLKAYKHTIKVTHDRDSQKDLNNVEIFRRVRIADNCLQFRIFADEPHDANGRAPRAEISPVHKIVKGKEFCINYCFTPIGGDKSSKYAVLQLMDHTPKRRPCPVFQLEIRHSRLFVKYCHFKDDGEYEGADIDRIAHIDWENEKEFDVKVHGLISPFKGYFIVSVNGVHVWSRSAPNGSSRDCGVSMHYGIYGNLKTLVQTKVKHFKYCV